MRKRRLKFYANIKIKELFRLRLLKHFKHCEKIYVKPKMRSFGNEIDFRIKRRPLPNKETLQIRPLLKH